MKFELAIGYKNNTLYEHVKFHFPENGIISFVGDNGCGKSTIYKTLLGIIPPIKGRVPNSIKEKIAIVSDYVQMPMEVQVQDILDILGSEKVIYGKENYGHIYEIIFRLKNQYVKSLSSGQRRIVEIFSALASGKKIILLDEASNALDYKNKAFFLEEVKKLSNKDIVFLHTSHDMEDISFLKGTIYGLFKEEGKVKLYSGDIYSTQDVRKFLGYEKGKI